MAGSRIFGGPSADFGRVRIIEAAVRAFPGVPRARSSVSIARRSNSLRGSDENQAPPGDIIVLARLCPHEPSRPPAHGYRGRRGRCFVMSSISQDQEPSKAVFKAARAQAGLQASPERRVGRSPFEASVRDAPASFRRQVEQRLGLQRAMNDQVRITFNCHCVVSIVVLGRQESHFRADRRPVHAG